MTERYRTGRQSGPQWYFRGGIETIRLRPTGFAGNELSLGGSFWLRQLPRLDGAQGRDRTTDTAIFSRMLYQLSYLGMSRRETQERPVYSRGGRLCPPAFAFGYGAARPRLRRYRQTVGNITLFGSSSPSFRDGIGVARMDVARQVRPSGAR